MIYALRCRLSTKTEQYPLTPCREFIQHFCNDNSKLNLSMSEMTLAHILLLVNFILNTFKILLRYTSLFNVIKRIFTQKSAQFLKKSSLKHLNVTLKSIDWTLSHKRLCHALPIKVR